MPRSQAAKLVAKNRSPLGLTVWPMAFRKETARNLQVSEGFTVANRHAKEVSGYSEMDRIS